MTINIAPVNDVPVAYPRALSIAEAVEADGQTAVLSFTANQLINGNGTETPSVKGCSPVVSTRCMTNRSKRYAWSRLMCLDSLPSMWLH